MGEVYFLLRCISTTQYWLWRGNYRIMWGWYCLYKTSQHRFMVHTCHVCLKTWKREADINYREKGGPLATSKAGWLVGVKPCTETLRKTEEMRERGRGSRLWENKTFHHLSNSTLPSSLHRRGEVWGKIPLWSCTIHFNGLKCWKTVELNGYPAGEGRDRQGTAASGYQTN